MVFKRLWLSLKASHHKPEKHTAYIATKSATIKIKYRAL